MKNVVVFNLWGENGKRQIYRNTAAIISALMTSDHLHVREQVVEELNAVSLDENKLTVQVNGINTYVVYNNPIVDTFINDFCSRNEADCIHLTGHSSSWEGEDGKKQAEIMLSGTFVNVREELAQRLNDIKFSPTCKVFFELSTGFDVALCIAGEDVGRRKIQSLTGGKKGLPGALCRIT